GRPAAGAAPPSGPGSGTGTGRGAGGGRGAPADPSASAPTTGVVPEEMPDVYRQLAGALRRTPTPDAAGVKNALEELTYADPTFKQLRAEDQIDSSFVNQLASSGFIASLY